MDTMTNFYLEMSHPSQSHAPRHNYQIVRNLHPYIDAVQGITSGTAEAGMTPRQEANSINMYANAPQLLLHSTKVPA